MKDLLKREGAKEGYYPLLYSAGGTTTDLIAEPIEKELGLNLSDVNMISLMETYPYMLFQRNPAPWGATLAGLVKYVKENPGKLKYISLEVGSMNDIVCEYMLSVLGIKDFKKIPQGTHGEVAAVVGSGEGDIGNEFGEIIMPHFQGGRAAVILIGGEIVPPPWDKDPNVLTTQAANKLGFNFPVPFPFTGSRGWTAPKGTPQSHVDWLYKLIKATAATPAFKQTCNNCSRAPCGLSASGREQCP
jgi:tripartite-type tricarboxylate transporter receptor subunit TctC